MAIAIRSTQTKQMNVSTPNVIDERLEKKFVSNQVYMTADCQEISNHK